MIIMANSISLFARRVHAPLRSFVPSFVRRARASFTSRWMLPTIALRSRLDSSSAASGEDTQPRVRKLGHARQLTVDWLAVMNGRELFASSQHSRRTTNRSSRQTNNCIAKQLAVFGPASGWLGPAAYLGADSARLQIASSAGRCSLAASCSSRWPQSSRPLGELLVATVVLCPTWFVPGATHDRWPRRDWLCQRSVNVSNGRRRRRQLAERMQRPRASSEQRGGAPRAVKEKVREKGR